MEVKDVKERTGEPFLAPRAVLDTRAKNAFLERLERAFWVILQDLCAYDFELVCRLEKKWRAPSYLRAGPSCLRAGKWRVALRDR